MIARTTAKLQGYVGVSVLCLFLGIAAGQAELIAVAGTFVVAIVASLGRTSRSAMTAQLSSGADVLLEGDAFAATVDLARAAGRGPVEIAVALPRGVEARDRDVSVVTLGPNEERSVSLQLTAARWGVQRIGPVAVRAWGPGRMVVFEQLFDHRVVVKVYPSSERLHRGLTPVRMRSYAGDYVSGSAGEGIEFAAVRPYVAGDSVRRVNWRVTSRRSALHVNLAHPERNADLVLFLDTFADVHLQRARLLDLTVRGAAALARHHLRHNDRVGLVSFGGTTRWLTASMGRTHTYRIADFLLDTNATFSYAWKNIDRLPPNTLPSGATVVALSPLIDARAVSALTEIAARGFALVVVNTLSEEEVDPLGTDEGRVSHRVWKLQREALRAQLGAAGIPTVTWSGHEGIGTALAKLPKRGPAVRTR